MSTSSPLVLTERRTPCPVLELRRWRCRTTAPFWCPRGAHDALEIAWVESGRASYRVGRATLTAGPGEVVLMPPGVEHATGFADPVDGSSIHATSIHLDATLLAEIADVLGPGARALAPGIVRSAARIVQIGRLLLEQAGEGDAGGALAAGALAEVLAVEALRVGPTDQTRAPCADPRITAAIARVESCYDQPLSVEDLARTAGMSRFHFSRRFREVTGQSPYRFLIETRLRRAAALLRGGHHSVTEAALCAGFSDLGRFSRTFRAWSGTAPHRYARSAARSAHNSARTA